MKSFSQFLQESYLSEEIPAGMTRAQYNALPAESRRRLTGGSGAAMGRQGQPLSGAASAPAIRSARQGMSGQQAAAVGGVTAAGAAATLANTAGDNPAKPKLNDMLDSDIKTTKVSSPARRPSGAAADLFSQFSKKPQKQYGIPNPPSSSVPYGNRTLSGTSPTPALSARGETTRTGNAPLATRGTNPQAPPEALMRGAYDAANKPPATPKPSAPTPSSTVKPPAPAGPSSSSSTSSRFKAALEKQRKAAAGTGPSGRTIVTPAPESPSGGKPPAGPKLKVPSGARRALRIGGRLLGPAAAALDVADERAKGSGWLRSGLKAAVVGGAGALGAAAGAPLTPVGSIAAGTGAAIAASKAFDTVAGANAVQRKAMATANRQSQSGGALKGIGGKTTFDTKKGTMTTGSGSQQRTVKLGKTSVVTDPKTGKQDVGYLAYKGGKAVYKRADTKNLAQTSSNPLERIGRSLFAGAYKQSDAAAAAKKLAAARQSDVARQKALGVKMKPGG